MDRKLMCVANVQYKKPNNNENNSMSNLLKYLTYRESRDERARQAGGRERWLDRGMGSSVKEIARRCEAYQSKHVLLFSVVINPNPDLLRMVPPAKREQFVRQLTEQTMNNFFDARGIDTGVEWSAVLHHRQTDGEEAPGQHNPHMHVILPGTFYDADEGRRNALYFSRNKSVNHIDLLHTVTEENMAHLMDRYVGREWEQRYDQLHELRERQEQIAYVEQPHGLWEGVPVWAGIRRTDENTSAAGVYGVFPDREGKTKVQFRPILGEMNHKDAEIAAEALKKQLQPAERQVEYHNDPRPTFDIDF